MDEATIVTIHGFAQRAATENAFESALAFDRGEAVDDSTIYREATHDYWREQVFANGDDGEAVLNIWASPEALYATLAPVFFRPHVTIAGIDHERIAERLESLARHWPDTPPTLAAPSEVPIRHRRFAAPRRDAPAAQRRRSAPPHPAAAA